jgi:hypothetical protein
MEERAERSESLFETEKKVYIERPQSERTFLIEFSDWEFLRKKVEQLREPPIFFNSLGWASIGIAPTALIAGLLAPVGTDSTALTICWVISAVAFACAILSICFYRRDVRDFSAFRKQNIIEELDRIKPLAKETGRIANQT